MSCYGNSCTSCIYFVEGDLYCTLRYCSPFGDSIWEVATQCEYNRMTTSSALLLVMHVLSTLVQKGRNNSWRNAQVKIELEASEDMTRQTSIWLLARTFVFSALCMIRSKVIMFWALLPLQFLIRYSPLSNVSSIAIGYCSVVRITYCSHSIPLLFLVRYNRINKPIFLKNKLIYYFAHR